MVTGLPTFAWTAVMMIPPTSNAASPFTIGTQLVLVQTGLSQVSTFAFPNVASDTIVTQFAPQTLDFKTMDAYLNSFSGVYQSYSIKRVGGFQSIPTVAVAGSQGLDGALAANTHAAASVSQPSWDSTIGLFTRYTSSTSANNNAGIISPTTGIGCCITNMATRIVARVRVNTTTAERLYFGVTSNTVLPKSDTPLGSGDSGAIIGYNQGTESGGTANLWELFNNDASGTMVQQTLGIGNSDTNWHLLQLTWPAGASQITAQVDSNNPITITSRYPAATTGLYFNCVGQNTSTSAITTDIHAAFLETFG
jgi:hypothetical protein